MSVGRPDAAKDCDERQFSNRLIQVLFLDSPGKLGGELPGFGLGAQHPLVDIANEHDDALHPCMLIEHGDTARLHPQPASITPQMQKLAVDRRALTQLLP